MLSVAVGIDFPDDICQQKTRSNAETVESLCREISKLTKLVEDVRGQVETRVKRFEAGSREHQDLVNSLVQSDELRLRSERLNRYVCSSMS